MKNKIKILGIALLIVGILFIIYYLNIIPALKTLSVASINEPLGPNQLLVAETFSGGATISKTSLRYPVVNFSSVLPTIIMDANTNSVTLDATKEYCSQCASQSSLLNGVDGYLTQTSVDSDNCSRYNLNTIQAHCRCFQYNKVCDASVPGATQVVSPSQLGLYNQWNSCDYSSVTQTNLGGCVSKSQVYGTIYNELNNGQVLQIPSYQTWTLFYIINNNYQLPTICDIVDAKTGQCVEISTGIITICSAGQFDPSTGLCVVQPSSTYLCPSGGRYDTSQGVCIFNPPIQYLCQNGSVYNINIQTCQITPISQYVCPSGFVYNSTTNKCENYPLKQIICQSGFAYDVSTDKCLKFPDSRTICPVGSNFNSATGFCESHPSQNFVCNSGFTYNSTTGNCEFRPSDKIICGTGTYNSTIGACVVNPPTNFVCNIGVLTDIGNGNKACIYTPESISNCPSNSTYDSSTDKCVIVPPNSYSCPTGFTYNSTSNLCELGVQISCIQGTFDASKNACIYSPNLLYLCLEGTYDSLTNTCKITPQTTIVCPQYYIYNQTLDKCVKTPDINNPTPTTHSEFFLIIGIILIILSLIIFIL